MSGSRFVCAEAASFDRIFSYPRSERGLGLFCFALFAALLLFFYSPTLLSLPWKAFALLCAIALEVVFFAAIICWDLPLVRNLTRPRVVLHSDGITVGRRRVAWNDIDEVKWTPPPARFVRLCLKNAPRKFFTCKLAGRCVQLPAYPFVFQVIIPALLEARPDVKVATGVRKGLMDPERGMKPRFWIAFASATLSAVLCWMALQAEYQTFSYLPMIAVALFCVGLGGAVLAVPRPVHAREVFLATSLFCSTAAAATIAFEVAGFRGTFAGATEVMLAAGIAISLVAAFVALTRLRLIPFRQIIIAAVLVCVPALTFLTVRDSFLPTRDITSLFGTDTPASPVWSRSSEYLANVLGSNMEAVIRLPSLHRVPISCHTGGYVVFWLDKSYLVRRVGGQGDHPLLLVYEFATGREFEVKAAETFAVSFTRPVSFDGRLLIWFDKNKVRTEATLRLWDLKEHRLIDTPPALRELPGGICWEEALWTDKTQGVVLGWPDAKGDLYSEPKSIRLLRFDIAANTTELFQSAHRFEVWLPTPDFRYALGGAKEDAEPIVTHLVDLVTDEAKPLSKARFVCWLADGRTACLDGDLAGRRMLYRLDVETAQVARFCDVPNGMAVQDVSRTGRYALLSPSGIIEPGNFQIVDTSSQRKYRARPGGTVVWGPMLWQSAARLGVSYWSPDERYCVIQTFRFTPQPPGFATHLVTVAAQPGEARLQR